jgi:hypothetical protein
MRNWRKPRASPIPLAHVRGGAAAVCLAALLLLSGCGITLPLPRTAVSQSPTGPLTVTLRILRGADNSTLAVAPVYFGNHGPFNFVVDTGASVSLISRQLARQLGLPQSGSRQPVSGVGGVEQIVFVTVSSWRAGQLVLPAGVIGSGQLALNSGDANLQGLLGSDVWSQFGKVTLDYNAGTLTVYKAVASRPPSTDGVHIAHRVTS